jgi:hypothetical protein
MRFFRAFAVCAVMAGSIVGLSAGPASAGELCEQAWLSGQWLVPVVPAAYGGCQPFDGTWCHYEEAAADPQVHVATYLCVPDPVATP